MTLCEDGHDEVCYAGRNCPACAAVKDKESAEEATEEAKDGLAEVQKTCDRAEADHLVLYRENQRLTQKIAELAVHAAMAEP